MPGLEGFVLKNPEQVSLRITNGELAKVKPLTEVTECLFQKAEGALEGATTLAAARLRDEAFALAESCIQQAGMGFLNHQGLRPTSSNGHHAVVLDTIGDQIPAIRAVISTAQAVRQRRNSLVYASTVTYASEAELTEAIDVARQFLTVLRRIVNEAAVRVFV